MKNVSSSLVQGYDDWLSRPKKWPYMHAIVSALVEEMVLVPIVVLAVMFE
jgi:hypothetical protein